MNITIRHISHLLRDSDVLAVPELGVFSRHRVSARFDDGMLLPPSEEIVFVAQSVVDDDFLARSIARSLSCSIEEATVRMAEDIADIKARLSAGQTISLGNAGRLSPSVAGVPVFEMSQSFAERSFTSWLAPVASYVNVIADKPVEESEVEDESRRKVFMQSLQRTASSAAAIALLALIAFVASQLPRKGESEPNLASFGFETVDIQPSADISEPATSDKALVLILNTPSDGMSIVEPVEKKCESRAVPEADYLLVVASLASSAEAERFIAANSDVPGLSVVDSEGRYRVYAASGATFAETRASAAAAGLFERFPSAWICRK